jgi:hypothetical protein
MISGVHSPSPRQVHLAIACQFPDCLKVAAVVELDPIEPGAARRTDTGTIRVYGFLPFAKVGTSVYNYGNTVAVVLDAGDDAAAALHAINSVYTPFFCRECRRSYCGQHWNLEPVFDFGFDYYWGTCPSEHPHFIDH